MDNEKRTEAFGSSEDAGASAKQGAGEAAGTVAAPVPLGDADARAESAAAQPDAPRIVSRGGADPDEAPSDAPTIVGAPKTVSKKKIAAIIAAVAVACVLAFAAVWGAQGPNDQTASQPAQEEQAQSEDASSPEAEASDAQEDPPADEGSAADEAAEDGGSGNEADDSAADAEEPANTTADGGAESESDASPSSAESAAPAASGPSSSDAGSSSASSGHSSSSAGSSSSAAGSGTSAPQTITVSVTIDASNAHAADASWPSSMYSGSVTVKQGASVYDALLATGASVGGSSYYVSSINGLAEKALSSGSGWMYKVNGTYPNYSCGKYKLSGGEDIVWAYTVTEGDVS